MLRVVLTTGLAACRKRSSFCRRRRDFRRAADDGFTLIEILVVLAILALMAGLVAPRVIGFLGGAKTDTARIQMSNIEASLDLYRLDVGQYPETIRALFEPPSNEDRWRGPYLKKADGVTDPWGEQYVYRFPGEKGEYDLYTLGADKKEGGQGENEDVTSW